MSLRCNKVLVLGATGFIGCRLVEKLYLYHDHNPRCLFRDYSKLPRLARLPVEMIYGDVLEPEQFSEKIADCDVFIFSVHGKDKNQAKSWRINTAGLENILQLAVTQQAKQFIFLSTAAIYERQFDNNVIDESVVPIIIKKDYSGGKLEGERLCLEYAKEYDLPITILRPTIVYGPFAPSFTIYPAQLVRTGILKDYGFFTGLCNPIYVDDVVDVIIECILNEKAYNNDFIVASGQTMSWKDFFDAYSKAISGRTMEKCSLLAYYAKSVPLSLMKKALKTGVQFAPGLAKAIYARLKSRGTGDWTWVKGQDISTLKPTQFKKQLEFKIDKLRNELGYEPKYDFESGFTKTLDWLKHHRYVSKNFVP